MNLYGRMCAQMFLEEIELKRKLNPGHIAGFIYFSIVSFNLLYFFITTVFYFIAGESYSLPIDSDVPSNSTVYFRLFALYSFVIAIISCIGAIFGSIVWRYIFGRIRFNIPLNIACVASIIGMALIIAYFSFDSIAMWQGSYLLDIVNKYDPKVISFWKVILCVPFAPILGPLVVLMIQEIMSLSKFVRSKE